jgi:hypothetical protein
MDARCYDNATYVECFVEAELDTETQCVGGWTSVR